jgi:hypothetical protein
VVNERDHEVPLNGLTCPARAHADWGGRSRTIHVKSSSHHFHLSLSLSLPRWKKKFGVPKSAPAPQKKFIHPAPPPIAIQVLSPCPVLCGKRSGPRGSDSKTPSPRWIPRRFGRRAPNLVRNHSLTPFSQTICNGDFSLIAALLQVQ